MNQWKECKLEENINYIDFINPSLFCCPNQAQQSQQDIVLVVIFLNTEIYT